MQRSDYVKQDIGNLVLLEHVNLTIPDQRLAIAFYVTGLGLTRDPYMMTGVTNMWINVGRSQIHLPHGEAAYFGEAGHAFRVKVDRYFARSWTVGAQRRRGFLVLL